MRLQCWPAKLLTGAALLGSLPIATASRSTSTHGNGFNGDTSATVAAEEWEKNKLCHPGYFEKTEGNLRTMNLSQWYKATISSLMDESSEAYDELGEASLVGAIVAGAVNFNCTSTSNACSGVPKCEEVVNFVEKKNNSTLSSADLVDLARYTYFAVLQTNDFNEYLRTLISLITKVQVNIGDLADTIVREFTDQPDPSAERLCLVYKELVNFAKKFIQNMNSMAWNIMLAGKSEIDELAGIPNPAPAINSVLDIIQTSIEVSSQNKQAEKQATWQDTSDAAVADGELVMPQKYLQGICAAIGGGKTDENYLRSGKMRENIMEIFGELGDVLEKFRAGLMKGSLHGKNQSLSLYIGHPMVANVVQRLRDDQSRFESNFTARFQEFYIAESLRNSKCYTKCEVGHSRSGKSRCKEEGYYCLPQRPDVVCRAQCFTTQDTGNHERELIGSNHLQRYKLSLTKIAADSVNYYLMHGNNYTTASKSAGQAMLSLDTMVNGGESMVRLPVCISKYVEMGNFGDRGRHATFPFSCGDWTGNETEQFHTSLHLARGQKDFDLKMAHELFEQTIPWQTENLPPLTHYLALCRNGIQFPRRGDFPPSYDMTRGPDRRCDRMLADLQEKMQKGNFTEGEANHWFCTESVTGKNIMHGELPSATGMVRLLYSHNKKCKEFLHKYEDVDPRDIQL